MAELGNIEIPLIGDDPKCPVCQENIPVICDVALRSGEAQRLSGSFGQPAITVNIQYDIVTVKINHTCEVKAHG